MVVTAQRVPAMIPGTAVPRIGEKDVLAFIVADPVPATLRLGQLFRLAAQAASGCAFERALARSHNSTVGILGLAGEILLSGLEKFAGLLNHGFNLVELDGLPYFIIGGDPFLKSRKKPSVIFLVKDARLGKVFSESSVDSAVFPESQTLLVQEGLCHIKHGVVSATRSEFGMVIGQKLLRGKDGLFGLFKELLRYFLHAAIASSRTLARNGLSRSRQSRSRRYTLLMLTLYFNERSEPS